MAKAKKNVVSLATGAALSVAFIAGAHAADNPFAMKSLEKGYMVADAGDKAKGDMKMEQKGDMKMEKKADKKMEEMKPTDKKMPEGKCGEGKCGANKK